MPATNDTFNYLAVLFSIIVGLAATELLQGVRGLLIARRRVVPYWPALVRGATMMLILAQTWWASFGLRTHVDWTFGMYGVVLLQIVLLYLVTALALPNALESESEIDMRAEYFAHATLFYLLLVAAALASVTKDVVINGRLPDPANLAFHALAITISLTLAVSRSDWLHKIATATLFGTFAAYVVLLFDRLPT